MVVSPWIHINNGCMVQLLVRRDSPKLSRLTRFYGINLGPRNIYTRVYMRKAVEMERGLKMKKATGLAGSCDPLYISSFLFSFSSIFSLFVLPIHAYFLRTHLKLLETWLSYTDRLLGPLESGIQSENMSFFAITVISSII